MSWAYRSRLAPLPGCGNREDPEPGGVARSSLKLGDGRNVAVPLVRLSPPDREFLEMGAVGEERGESTSEPGKQEESGELNWDDDWPDEVRFDDDPGIEVVEENTETNRYVYTSGNYRFTCDARLSKSVVSTFADMFEATRLLCRALPLAITGGVKNDGKYDILLFETKESYIEAGGPPTSAGVFLGGRNLVMVPLTSLGVRPVGSGYMRDRDKSDGTLIHELVHQLTPNAYYRPGAMGWFTEGIAEYCTATQYRNGRFRLRGNLGEIEEFVTGWGSDDKGGRGLGEEIRVPRLEDYMLMDYGEFTGDEANLNYGFGLILTTYFLHLDGEGDGARLKEFLKDLRKPGNRGDSTAALAKLLDGRSWRELEEDVARAWGRKGIDLVFPDPAD